MRVCINSYKTLKDKLAGAFADGFFEDKSSQSLSVKKGAIDIQTAIPGLTVNNDDIPGSLIKILKASDRVEFESENPRSISGDQWFRGKAFLYPNVTPDKTKPVAEISIYYKQPVDLQTIEINITFTGTGIGNKNLELKDASPELLGLFRDKVWQHIKSNFAGS